MFINNFSECTKFHNTVSYNFKQTRLFGVSGKTLFFTFWLQKLKVKVVSVLRHYIKNLLCNSYVSFIASAKSIMQLCNLYMLSGTCLICKRAFRVQLSMYCYAIQLDNVITAKQSIAKGAIRWKFQLSLQCSFGRLNIQTAGVPMQPCVGCSQGKSSFNGLRPSAPAAQTDTCGRRLVVEIFMIKKCCIRITQQ